MKKLNNKELRSLKAGASFGAVFAGIVSAITFIAGLIDGIARPFKCR